MLARRTLLALFATLPLAARAAPVPYRLQADRSTVGFTYYFGDQPSTGTMPVAEADLSLDFGTVSRSAVAVSLDVSRARTGFGLATEALKSRSVLDAGRHPRIGFVARRITGGGTTARLEGDLNLRGQTRPLTLDATLYRQQGSAAGDLTDLSLILTGSLDRRDWGATGYADLVGPQVDLRILARITRA